MALPQTVLPAKAGIPLFFDPIGGDSNFFTNSFAGMTDWAGADALKFEAG